MKKVLTLLGALALAASLGGCLSNDQLVADINAGVKVVQAVTCVVGGSGGNLTAKIEKQVKANNAWIGTTGDIIAINADICAAMGGIVGVPTTIITK